MVSIIMGSSSDLAVMQSAVDLLKSFSVPFEVSIVSAHRTPEHMVTFAKEARSRGIKVIVAGAGGAAHLPGMVASLTTLPVVGVPVKSTNSLDGWDSLLSIVQMPNGIPVATVAVNAAANAALLALRMLSITDLGLADKLEEYRKGLEEKVRNDDAALRNKA
jgi:5-(carboxyamino)imidazole ribonucleotide mutase